MYLVTILVASLLQEAAEQPRKYETPLEVHNWVAGDLLSLPEEEQPHMFYVWLPSWNPATHHHALTFAVNSAMSYSGAIQKPTILANGYLQRWDLRLLCPEDSQYQLVSSVMEEMNLADPYTTGTARCFRSDWFLSRILSSIEDGAYIKLRGYRSLNDTDKKSGGSNRTNEEIALARFGIFESASFSLDGDRRVGIFESRVTGKARTVIQLNGLIGSGWVTEDIFDEDVDAQSHPIYNLLDNNFRGREIIIEMNNGLHAYLITDNNGNILDEAPPNLVSDHRIPSPHTKRLQGGAISCVRCHGEESGLRSVSNDVAAILSSGFDVIDASRDDVATRYSGRKFERSLVLGRVNYELTLSEITGGALKPVELTDLVSSIYGEWRYRTITLDTAAKELGVDDAASLRSMYQQTGTTVVDPSIAALMINRPIRRTDFERIYQHLLTTIHSSTTGEQQ